MPGRDLVRQVANARLASGWGFAFCGDGEVLEAGCEHEVVLRFLYDSTRPNTIAGRAFKIVEGPRTVDNGEFLHPNGGGLGGK